MNKGFSPVVILIVILFLGLGIFYLGQTNQLNRLIENPSSSEVPTPTPTGSQTPTATPNPSKTPSPAATPTPRPTTSETKRSKVLLLIYNPVLENQGNKKLTDYKGWNNPVNLTQGFINSVRTTSGGYLNYEISSQMEIDGYPIKADGFGYTDETYINCLGNTSGCHMPDLASYQKMIETSGACEKANRGEIDELWIWGGPYFGYWESNLAGPGAFWYNSSPTTGANCTKLLPIMGFNYERGEAEMFEDLGHRLESTMTKVYGSWSANESHAWNKFALLDVDAPGRGGCGNAHLAVNAGSNQGYDRTNSRTVNSTCEDFLNYPNLTGNKTSISCSNWGCTTLGYFKWWFNHLPRAQGSTGGKLNNWWKYISEPNLAI